MLQSSKPSRIHVYHGLNCIPLPRRNSCVEALSYSIHNVTVFGDRIFKEVIKLK